jgi:hypothetical protein
MNGFIGVPLQLHSILIAYDLWFSTIRSIPCWTTSAFPSIMTNEEFLPTPWTALNDVCLSKAQ